MTDMQHRLWAKTVFGLGILALAAFVCWLCSSPGPLWLLVLLVLICG
jgi:hypothetical protein